MSFSTNQAQPWYPTGTIKPLFIIYKAKKLGQTILGGVQHFTQKLESSTENMKREEILNFSETFNFQTYHISFCNMCVILSGQGLL